MAVDKPERLAEALFLLVEGAFSATLTRAAGMAPTGDALLWAAEALLAPRQGDKPTR